MIEIIVIRSHCVIVFDQQFIYKIRKKKQVLLILKHKIIQ